MVKLMRVRGRGTEIERDREGIYREGRGGGRRKGEREPLCYLTCPSGIHYSWRVWRQKTFLVLRTLFTTQVTPGCGYVDQTGAFFMGLIAGPACFFAIKLKEKLG